MPKHFAALTLVLMVGIVLIRVFQRARRTIAERAAPLLSPSFVSVQHERGSSASAQTTCGMAFRSTVNIVTACSL